MYTEYIQTKRYINIFLIKKNRIHLLCQRNNNKEKNNKTLYFSLNDVFQ